MSKFTCLVLCVVAVVGFSSVNGGAGDVKAAIREAIKPQINECSQQHGVSEADLESAKKAGSANGLNPCFISCVYKKIGILNERGEYDANIGLTKLRKFVKNDESFQNLTNIGKQCATANEKAVSDGAAGCQRAALLTDCFFQHRAEIPV